MFARRFSEQKRSCRDVSEVHPTLQRLDKTRRRSSVASIVPLPSRSKFGYQLRRGSVKGSVRPDDKLTHFCAVLMHDVLNTFFT